MSIATALTQWTFIYKPLKRDVQINIISPKIIEMALFVFVFSLQLKTLQEFTLLV